MPNWAEISFQDGRSPIIEQIIMFHDHAIIILILITSITLFLVATTFFSKRFNKFIIEEQRIETIWTVSPAFLLIFLALPSLKTLYMIEDTKDSRVSLKTLGHQWYWSYEIPTKKEEEMEIFIEPSKAFRLLKTREPLTLPSNSSIRSLITSADVIHSWTLPSLGVKSDAFPGRLNQSFIFSKRLGLHVGQCSEICGINHSFIPILINFKTPKEFLNHIIV